MLLSKLDDDIWQEFKALYENPVNMQNVSLAELMSAISQHFKERDVANRIHKMFESRQRILETVSKEGCEVVCCPFCAFSGKDISRLRQHARNFSKKNAAEHRGLFRYLEEKASAAKEKETNISELKGRQEIAAPLFSAVSTAEDAIVWPPVVIFANITCADEKELNEDGLISNDTLREKLGSCLAALGITSTKRSFMYYDCKGNSTDKAFVEFCADARAYWQADDLDKTMSLRRRGYQDYEEIGRSGRVDKEAYAWMASPADMHSLDRNRKRVKWCLVARSQVRDEVCKLGEAARKEIEVAMRDTERAQQELAKYLQDSIGAKREADLAHNELQSLKRRCTSVKEEAQQAKQELKVHQQLYEETQDLLQCVLYQERKLSDDQQAFYAACDAGILDGFITQYKTIGRIDLAIIKEVYKERFGTPPKKSGKSEEKQAFELCETLKAAIDAKLAPTAEQLADMDWGDSDKPWTPVKGRTNADGKREEYIDCSDSFLKSLEDEWGLKLASAVAKEAMLLHKYNTSGGYAFNRPWCVAENRIATPAEVVSELVKKLARSRGKK
ncbi:hypothetical protein CYMTET_34375 [Cymbomonas tetramitiformis]|uniref:Uncharacterized protein n=1 Tax=Cymbomonas tetramitiformis TaxID=36881 RepID=A0AAE0FB80_9CHLO|nr:hypothetical protein CYMTET_34375 [Cymbomonas tetramitiformis]